MLFQSLGLTLVLVDFQNDTCQVVRSLNLNPEDWLGVTWEPYEPLPKPATKPFNRKNCLTRLKRVFRAYSRGYVWLDWAKVTVAIALSSEEACFWFQAMTHELW